MIGQIHAYIENHDGLTAFSDTELILKMKKGSVKITGESFVLKMMLPEEILLEGTITDVRFVRDEEWEENMKPIQGVYFQGYVKLTVKGNNPELFFQKCIDHRIVVWNVKKTADDVCEGYVKVSDIRAIRKLNRQTKNKIYFTEKKGYPFLFHRFLRQRPLWIGLIFLGNSPVFCFVEYRLER